MNVEFPCHTQELNICSVFLARNAYLLKVRWRGTGKHTYRWRHWWLRLPAHKLSRLTLSVASYTRWFVQTTQSARSAQAEREDRESDFMNSNLSWPTWGVREPGWGRTRPKIKIIPAAASLGGNVNITPARDPRQVFCQYVVDFQGVWDPGVV